MSEKATPELPQSGNGPEQPDELETATDLELADMLAEFTDQVLRDEDPEMLNTSIANEELFALQKMVVHLQQTLGRRQPDKRMARRIWANLAAAWQKSGRSRPRTSFWQQLFSGTWSDIFNGRPAGWQSSRSRRRTYATALALTAVLVVALTLPFIMTTGGALPGAAVGQPNLFPAILVPVLLIGGLIWYFFIRRR